MDVYFSIIIPVFNGLSHDLPLCLDSIWQQTIDNHLIEVICVDDCSSDNSREWIKKQMELHCNLRIIENDKNIRQGGARNRGVKESIGKYILFIDQDDYYESDSIRQIYNHLKNNHLDVFISDSAYQYKGHETKKLQLNLPYRDICSGEDFLLKNGPALAPWRLCIKKDFIINNDLWFVENCRIEDVDWACKVMYYAKKVQYLPILLVHYIKAESSQTDTMYKNINTLRDNTFAALRTLEVAYTLYNKSEAQPIITDLADNYFNITCRYLFGDWKPIYKKKEIINYIDMPNSKHELVILAQKYPLFFCIVSNLGVPFFRFIRFLKRKKQAIAN